MGDAKKLFSNSVVVFFGTIIGSIFAYFFNVIIGRLIGPSLYGDMTALMSLLMIASVGGSAVLTVVMRYSGELYCDGNFPAIIKLFRSFTFYVSLVSLAGILLGFLLIKPIASFLSLSNPLPVAITLVGILVNFLIFINKGLLQGTQKFLSLSIVIALEMILRLAIGLALVKVGFMLNGAVGAIVLATLFAYIISLFSVKTLAKEAKKSKQKTAFSFDKKEILSYSFPAFLTALLLVVSLNVDVILIKHYFPGEQAGYYAAISTIGKIILYLTAPIISVMFPMISEKKVKGEKHYKTFLLSIGLTLVGSLLALLAFSVAPKFVITILYGSNFSQFYYLLPQVGTYIVFYTLINLIANYFLAIRNFVFLWIYAAMIIIQVLAVRLYHPNIVGVVRLLMSTLGLLFVFLIGYYIFTKRDQIALMIRGEYGE